MTHSNLEWEAILNDAGLRATRQRGIVLEAANTGGHISVGDIYARAKQLDPTIRLSTVYRTLRVFSDLGVVLTIPSGDGELLYEVRHATPHHHLVCKRCGVQVTLAKEVAMNVIQDVEERHGFQVDLDHLILWGTCTQCRETGS